MCVGFISKSLGNAVHERAFQLQTTNRPLHTCSIIKLQYTITCPAIRFMMHKQAHMNWIHKVQNQLLKLNATRYMML
jgi:hypothetical protein